MLYLLPSTPFNTNHATNCEFSLCALNLPKGCSSGSSVNLLGATTLLLHMRKINPTVSTTIFILVASIAPALEKEVIHSVLHHRIIILSFHIIFNPLNE